MNPHIAELVRLLAEIAVDDFCGSDCSPQKEEARLEAGLQFKSTFSNEDQRQCPSQD